MGNEGNMEMKIEVIMVLCNSLFKIFEREQQSFPEKNMFVSSANNINSRMLE
jgi:hypothetical protein